MAELALAVAGVALAWKGVLDFGKLITRFADDSSRDRRSIALNLECSQRTLEDWGRHWGFGEEKSAFTKLEPWRQDLVRRIIVQLNELREPARRKLAERYGMGEMGGDQKKTGARVEGLVAAAKRGRRKVQWMAGDDDLLNKVVEDTKRLLDHLNHLTYMSSHFLAVQLNTMRQAASLDSKLLEMGDEVKQFASVHKKEILDATEVEKRDTKDAIDLHTVITYTTDSTMLSDQREAIIRYIEKSIHHVGDDRVPREVSTWWNDASAHILLLEFPDQAEDDTAMSVCVLLYYLVSCHRIIYIFEPQGEKDAAQQLLEMMQTFIASLMALPQNKILPDDVVPPSIHLADTEMMEQLVTFFLHLLEITLQSSSQRLLIIVGGLEYIDLDESSTTAKTFQDFVKSFQHLCLKKNGPPHTNFKALLTHKGHVTALYDCVGDTGIVDITNRGLRTCNLHTELVLSLGE